MCRHHAVRKAGGDTTRRNTQASDGKWFGETSRACRASTVGTYGSYLSLVPLEVLLRQSGQQEHDLCFDDGMYIRIGIVVHGGSPGPGRSLRRASTDATTSRSRFGRRKERKERAAMPSTDARSTPSTASTSLSTLCLNAGVRCFNLRFNWSAVPRIDLELTDPSKIGSALTLAQTR
jgi:hypothetical protein